MQRSTTKKLPDPSLTKHKFFVDIHHPSRIIREHDIVRLTRPRRSVLLPLKIDARLQREYLWAPILFS